MPIELFGEPNFLIPLDVRFIETQYFSSRSQHWLSLPETQLTKYSKHIRIQKGAATPRLPLRFFIHVNN
jgi:hypothetical protein